jgi:ATP adenylyltransferase
MVLPKLAERSMEDLDEATFAELWRAVRSATIAVKAAFSPHGVNVGINDGEAGGGSVPDHLHVHVVPRWRSDTNFITTTANARVLPIALVDTWERIRAAWPE